MSTEDQGGNDWADNVDYGDDDENENDTNMNEPNQNNNDWADDVDYGDDDDDDENDLNLDDEDGIGDLGLTDDDDDLPPSDALGPKTDFKSEITSTLENPNKIGISYKLEFDTTETPGDISDDDETAPGLKINHFQLISASQMDNNNNEYKSNNYDDTLLGSGSFAKVFRARNTRRNNKVVALKCMYKNLLRKQFLMKSKFDLKNNDDTPIVIRHTMLDAVQIELQIMMKIKHINIIRLYYIIDDPTKDSLYLTIEYSPFGQVMEFDGKLLKYIPNKNILPLNKYININNNMLKPWWYNKYVKKGNENDKNETWDIIETYNEKTARKLFMDCVVGIEYLHSLNIIHRDIKPENLLLFSDNQSDNEIGLIVKIADFGTAQQFEHKNEAILIDTQGTYHFMSPSAISGEKRNAFFDDIWALGIVLYSFIFGTIPYFHPLDYQLFESIQNDKLILPNDRLNVSNEIKDLIEKILNKKDDERIKLNEIIKHEWYSNENYIHPIYEIEEEEEEEEEINMYENQNRSSKDDCCIVV